MRRYTIWRTPELNAERETAINNLAAGGGINRVVAKMLVNRGVFDPAEALRFLEPVPERLGDPYDLPGMGRAVERLAQAIERGESILIYGDYDVDGVSSVAILKEALDQLTPHVSYYIPDRFSEGYGLNEDALSAARERGTELLITVDCGITSIREIAWARQIGMDAIVTDHHMPADELPDACALVNPKLRTDLGPEHDLAGAGVTYQLVRALAVRFPQLVPEDWEDLAALATVADIVPLVGDNRIIVKAGLSRLKDSRRPGLRALLEQSGLAGKEITAWHIGYIIAPRINAAGRMGEAEAAVRLLLAADDETARDYAARLETFNRRRQEVEAEVFAMASREAQACVARDDAFILAAGDEWHHGVLGIVASKIVDAYRRPTILISWDGERGRGSGRSMPGFDLYRALQDAQQLLEKFGGHQQAAGVTVQRSHFEALRAALNQAASGTWEPVTVLEADLEVRPEEITADLVREIERMQPFGSGNAAPVLIMRRVHVQEPVLVGKNNEHFKFRVRENDCRFEAIGFRLADFYDRPYNVRVYDLAFEPQINVFRGQEQLQLKIIDIKPSAQSDYGSGVPFGAAEPERPLEIMEARVMETVRALRPAVIVYPTIRCLEKHLPGLHNLFPGRLLSVLTGRQHPRTLRIRLEHLARSQPQIFLTTTAFYDYYRNIADSFDQIDAVYFWPDNSEIREKRGPSDVKFAFERLGCEISDLARQGKHLIYTNRKSALDGIHRNASGVYVEAGIENPARRDRLREAYRAADHGCLIWDGQYGGGLPAVPGKALILKNAPFGLFEITNGAAQTDELLERIVLAYAEDDLESNAAYLRAFYPDPGRIEAVWRRLTDRGRQFTLSRAEIKELIEHGGGANGFAESGFRAVLAILQELNCCEYTIHGDKYTLKMMGTAAPEVDPGRSPYLREGLQELKIFEAWRDLASKVQ
ncbi:MAG: single-stranded-DNA-specific exonuclease RecJ [Solirubrobacterales bacterium]